MAEGDGLRAGLGLYDQSQAVARALTLVLGTVAATSGYCVEGDRLHQITLGTSQGTTGRILVDSVAQRLTR